MKSAGKVALLNLPQVDLVPGKKRPVLILAEIPGQHDDWLVCMISTQLHQAVAVVSGSLLTGAIGNVGADRLHRIKAKLARWIGA